MPNRPAALAPPWSALPFLAALAAPTLLAFNLSPSATLLNQLLAVAGWGLVLLSLPELHRSRLSGAALPMLAAFALLMAAAWWSHLNGLPLSLTLPSFGLLGAAALVLWRANTVPEARGSGPAQCFFAGLLVAGVCSAGIAIVQVFIPAWADGQLIARSGLVGRAVGNLRQPNHLSSLLVWALIALVPLTQARRFLNLRLRGRMAAALGALLVLGVVLTASRTGVVGVGLVALWGLADRRLDGRIRLAMMAAPLLYLLWWLGVAAWAHETAHTFGGEVRLAEGDLSASRFGIWSNTLALIRANPLTGVGFGEFNFAWTLTEFPDRPVAFFDHTHNLPLQFAVELGLPLASLLIGLLLVSLVLAARRAWRVPGDAGAASRAAFMVVLLIGVHSLLEYPLWYAYFLLPAAWAWGWALRPVDSAQRHIAQTPGGLGRLAGVLLVAGAAFAAQDYAKVVVIFTPGDSAAPLPERIQRGQMSWLFAHHADYAAATTTEPPSRAMAAFGTTTHSLLDTRLMMDWAQALAESGHVDKARYVAARLREFRNPTSEDFFAVCKAPPPADAPPPFQCAPPAGRLTWRDFLR